MIKNCKQCNKEISKPYYLSLNSWAKTKFCSKKCFGMSLFSQEILECKSCKKDYRVSKVRKNTAMFCSRTCKGYASRKEKILRICKECKKEFFVLPSRMKHGNGITFCSWGCYEKQPVSYWLGKKRPEVKNWLNIIQKGHIPWNKNKKGEYSNVWSEKAKKSFKEKMSGENNLKWVKDRTQLKKLSNGEEYRNSPASKEWRLQVKNRDKWSCRIADINCDGRLEAHHILGWNVHPELRYEVNNGITLCHFHHPRKRNDEIKLSPYFQKLVGVKVQ